MKKISLLLALFLVIGLGKSFAGYTNIMNLTGCPFQFYSGYGTIVSGTTTYGFSFGPINVSAYGTNNYATPDAIPGFNCGAPQNLWSTGCAEITKVLGPNNEAFPIGKPPYTFYSSTNTPTCNGGNAYTMTWNSGSNNCDAVILIF